MPFKVNDLMIDVTSAKAAGAQPQCYNRTIICHLQCTIVGTVCALQCSHIPSICYLACSHLPTVICHYGCTYLPSIHPCYVGPTVITPTCPGTPIVDPQQFEDPAVLKERLQASLDALEQQQKAADEALKPQTVADVEMLETKLTEALATLRTQKAELQKKK